MTRYEGFDLFLFDLDGLLVETEEIQFKAYQQMCADYDLILPWTFEKYREYAHHSTELFRTELFNTMPKLKMKESNWSVLYAKKFAIYSQLLQKETISLMPGVERLLNILQKEKVKHAVVTHSSYEHFKLIAAQHQILRNIPHQITRQDYHLPKPDPECYQLAISKLANQNDKIIGFEDTPRGIRALMGSLAKPVLITPYIYPQMEHLEKGGVEIYPNLDHWIHRIPK